MEKGGVVNRDGWFGSGLRRRAVFPLVAASVLVAAGCSRQVAPNDTSREPEHSAADSAFSGVFSPWNGTWQGRYFVYEDFGAQKSGTTPPKSPDDFEGLVLQLAVKTSFGITAQFAAGSPLFQKVVMEESTQRADGVVKDQYRGVRKVQDGRLFWVMDRAGSSIAMEGESLGPGKMVWRRKAANGSVAETRYETVSGSSIRITGWIYGDEDDEALSPRLWIRCDLKRSENAVRVPKMYE